jgi:hypothetical protein
MENKLKLSKFEGGGGVGEGLVNSTKYRKLVRSLIYLTNIRSYLSYSITIISRFM